MTNLQTRLLAAFILMPISVFVAVTGGFLFQIFILLIAAIALYEWWQIVVPHNEFRNYQYIGVVFSLSIFNFSYADMPTFGAFIWMFFISLFFSLFQNGWRARLGLGFGIFYIGLAALSLVHMRMDEVVGISLITLCFSIVWSTDTGGYMFGKILKGPKLYPSISPNKTYSGFFGAIIFALFCSWFIFSFVPILQWEGFDMALLLIITFALSILSQLGDLFESWLKRRNGIKDSGSIIPGHGGVLDRLDGLIAVSFGVLLFGFYLAVSTPEMAEQTIEMKPNYAFFSFLLNGSL